MPIRFRHARTPPASVDVVAVGVTPADLEAAPLPRVAVSARFLAAQGFEAKIGQTLAVPGDGHAGVVLVGLGPDDEVRAGTLRSASAAFARAAHRYRRAAVDLLSRPAADLDPADAVAAIVEGVALASYRFEVYASSPTTSRLESVTIVGGGGKKVATAIDRAAKVAEAVCWARDLVNEPGGSLTPTKLATAVRAMGRREKLKVSVMDEAAIRRARLGGLLGVNRGSEQAPRFVTVSYEPPGTRVGRVALVGKGITFDSGGLSLKSGEGMMTMKDDMAGAAAVLGAMAAIRAVEPSVAVTAYVPLTDNMTGGDAIRPGDVLTIRGGTTVEVLNTDAEGRLVLADALALASEEGPDALIDVATLTGACTVALGDRIAGLMGRGEDLLADLEAASERTGERVWRLPLPDDLRPRLDSKVADLKNIAGGRLAGALVAGIFLREFVDDRLPWAHLDIAGPAWSDDDHDEVTAGGTGFGVRLLLDLLSRWDAGSA